MTPDNPTIPFGFCRCGCGRTTRLAPQNHTVNGWKKGQPVKFLPGHGSKGNRHSHLTAQSRRPEPVFVALAGEHCVRIPLLSGNWATVSFSSYHKVEAYSWTESKGYAVARNADNKTIKMHRLVCGTPAGIGTDHINGDKLDNRDCNLRMATQQQNMQNKTAIHNLNSLGIRGVSPAATPGKFVARISIKRKSIHLGTFDSLQGATDARRAAAQQYYGDFARFDE